jgi:hypothetical protein
MTTVTWTNDPEIERTARRRAGARVGWIVHASVFVLVNLFLLALSSLTGARHIPVGALGWAFGLAVHGLVVLAFSSGLMETLVRRERTRLLAQRDPW